MMKNMNIKCLLLSVLATLSTHVFAGDTNTTDNTSNSQNNITSSQMMGNTEHHQSMGVNHTGNMGYNRHGMNAEEMRATMGSMSDEQIQAMASNCNGMMAQMQAIRNNQN